MNVNDLRNKAKDEGFSSGQEYVLHLINQGFGESIKGLARRLGVHDNSIRHHLNGYERVTRYIDPTKQEIVIRDKKGKTPG